MSQTEKELQTQKVVEAAVASALRFNEKQEYYFNDRTYPEHYIKNKGNILKSAGVGKDFHDSHIDQILAVREINDVIDKESPELKRLIEKGTVSIDMGDVYPSVNINTADIDYELVFSWEPEEDVNSGKIGLGGKIYIWGENEGTTERNLTEGIKALESAVLNKIYQVALEKEFNGELEENQAYKHLLEQASVNVNSVEIKSAEFSKFTSGKDEENHVTGVVKYTLDGRDFQSEWKQNISSGSDFKETLSNNLNMLRIFKPDSKHIDFIDVETGLKDSNVDFKLPPSIQDKIKESVATTLKNAEPVITANYNKPNPKLLNVVESADGKHYSFKPETLDALAKFGEALVQVENKKRNKLKI